MLEDSSNLDADAELDESLTARIVERLDRQWARERGWFANGLASVIGQKLGSYRIQEVIGRGAFGIVYLAVDDQRNRKLALKVPRPEVLTDSDRFSRFVREAELAAKLEHQGIVPVYEANFENSPPFIAYAYCRGPDLGKWLSCRTDPVPAIEAANFVALVAEAVEHAHSHGVLHRDLKPGNILVEPDSQNEIVESLNDCRPRLTDFGLAKLFEGGLQETRSSLLVGTPNYLAPEQLLGASYPSTPATDVYSLGVILFELVTLRRPFEGTTYFEVLDKLRHQQPPSLQSLNASVPLALDSICSKCLEKDPIDRYQTANALREDLQRFAMGQNLLRDNRGWWSNFCRWTRRPERLSQCGTASFWAQIFVMSWVWAYFGLSWRLGALEGTVLRTAAESTLLCLVFSVPLILLARRVALGSMSAFWPAFALLGLQFAGELFGFLSDQLVLSKFYSSVQSKLASYTMLLLGSISQLVLYVVAAPAWFRLRGSLPKESEDILH